MAQHDYVISNGTGAAVRSDLNNALSAIVTQNSGSTAPATTYAYQMWADTTAGVMKIRNGANSAWITLYQLDGEWTSIAFENGSAAAPSIYFKDSGTDTGFYSPGTDQVAISTGGTGRLFINSSGSVGIGTSSPHATFQIHDGAFVLSKPASGSERNWRILSSDAATGDFAIQQSTAAGGTTYSSKLQISASGNVGIGSNSPTRLLTVQSTGNADICIKGPNTSTSQLLFGDTDSDTPGVIAYNHSTNNMVFEVNAAERARIDSSGRLLVGTSSFSDGATLVLQGNSTNSNWDAVLRLLRNISNPAAGETLGSIIYGVGGAQGAQIQGVTDAQWGTNDYPTRLVFSTTADGASSPTERARINSTGTASFYGLDDVIYARSNRAAGGIYATFVGLRDATSTTNGTITFLVYTNGNVQNTNGSYTTISDVKLKENIIDANSQWDDLKAIKIRNWNFKAETGHETHRQIGPIAQELEIVCPGLVFETPDRDADGNETGEITKGVNQSVLYMKAVKALQEAMERIEQLETEMAEVKARLS